jgi:uncharacterized protein
MSVLVATHAVHPRQLAAFQDWAERLDATAREQAGFVAAARLEQSGGLTHLVQFFGSPAALADWQASERYRAFVAEGEALSVGLRQTADDPARIDVPAESSAPKWKSFLVTWLAVLPVLLILSSAIRAAFPQLPPLLQTAGSSVLLTAALTWIILPPVQRRARAWMLRTDEGRLRR